jgi:hypothetical protein
VTVEWKCDDCGWVKLGDYCVCPQEATDSDCHCIELTLMSAPDEPWRGRCEDAPCCGCCDAGSAVMLG